MIFAEALEFLRELQWFGARFGLETSRRLARRFGNPEDGLRFVHVAGTNGKGSTCAMLESIYRRAGLRVGLYTSPHLIRFGERIQVDREPISEDEAASQAGEFKVALAELGVPATFFEVVTIMALRHFAARDCDLVIWETGLGGRLDATNIVTPLVSVITNAQLDHEKWLGNTVGQIAYEKAGIIKPFRPAVTGAGPGEALDTIVRVAAEMSAPLTVSGGAAALTAKWPDLELPLPGAHQWQNAAVALATVEALRPVIPVADSVIEAGLREVRWAGRFQVLERADGTRVILDGAHNPAGMLALRSGLEQSFRDRRLTIVLGAMQDKDWRTMCRVIAPLATTIRVVPTGSERGAPVELLEAFCREANPNARVTSLPSLEEALTPVPGEEAVVVTGSLHLVGAALEWLLPRSEGGRGERSLNEWTKGRSQ